MSNDWGKPFTPEELAIVQAGTKPAANWGKPIDPETIKPVVTVNDGMRYIQQVGRATRPAPELPPVVVDVAEGWTPKPTPAKLTDTPEELTAKGWVQTAHDEWEKIAPDTSPFAGSKVTLKFNETVDVLIVDETHIPAWAPTPVNSVGSYYAPDGTLMNADGTRSIFDDVDAGPDGDPWPGQMGEAVKAATAAEIEELQTARTAPVETFSEADGPWYVVYFGPILYTVLAGPYDTQEAAAERIDRVWAQFEHDAAYDYSFPHRERSGLRASTVRTVYNLKGAYGKQ